MKSNNCVGVFFTALLWFYVVSSTTLEELSALRSNATFTMDSPYMLPLLQSFDETLAQEAVYIGSDHMNTDTMGNRLALYFEAMACCDIIGAHFIFRGNITGDEQATKFFSSFPAIRAHPKPSRTTSEQISMEWNKACPYVSPYPHVHEGAWNQRPDLIAHVMRSAVHAVFPNVHNATIPRDSFSHVLPKGIKVPALPLVPSAAIVFRCVDILFFSSTKPGYGFLNFNAYKELIPHNASSIYVLSEQLNYLDATTKNSIYWNDCKALSQYLVEFLHKQYPKATVALRRGYAIDSVAILSNAQTVISAPSSFALFPGIANPNRVYMMASGKRPVYFDRPFVHSNFMWLYQPVVIMGGDHVRKTSYALQKFKELFTKPLKQPVMYATDMPKVDICATIIPTPSECHKH